MTEFQPAWSPDGTKIAYVSTGRTGYEIFVMNADGSNPVQLTNNGDDEQPAWSPDGTKIAFWSDRYVADFGQHDREIYTMNATDGSNQTRGYRLRPGRHPPELAEPGSNQRRRHRLQRPNTRPTHDRHRQPHRRQHCRLHSALAPQPRPRRRKRQTSPATAPSPSSMPAPSSLSAATSTSAATPPPPALQRRRPRHCRRQRRHQRRPPPSPAPSSGASPSAAPPPPSRTPAPSPPSAATSTSATITAVNAGALATVGGNVDISGDPALTGPFNAGALATVGGNIDISGNNGSTVVNAGALAQVDGDLTLESAGSTLDLSGASVSGDVTLTANGADSVSAQTGGGATDVKVLGGTASMHVVLPAGSFDQPVQFTIDRQGDGAPEAGTTAGGAPATIDPVAGYRFSFAVPTLNQQAQLAFTVDLAQLDAATRAALLAGVQDGSATIVVKGDAPGAGYQAIARCSPGQTPAFNGCVDVFLLGPDGQPAPAGTVPAFVRFDGVAGHFSTYAVALITPVPPPDTTPPGVTITLSSPHAGTPDGQNGWFVSGPVKGTVSANDSTTGGSSITAIDCGPLTLSHVRSGHAERERHVLDRYRRHHAHQLYGNRQRRQHQHRRGQGRQAGQGTADRDLRRQHRQLRRPRHGRDHLYTC